MTSTRAGTSPDTIFVSTGSSSRVRTATSLRAMMPLGSEQVLEAGDDLSLDAVHALVQRLHGKIIAVAIDDQRGKQIAFRVHDAICIGVANNL